MIMLVVLVVTRSMDYVLYVRLSHKLGAYSWFFGSIVLAVIFNIISWPIVFYKLLFTNDITAAMRRASRWQIVLLGSLDAASGVLGTVAAARVSGPVQVVIAQVVIPCNMLLAWVLLGTRYRMTHFLAVLLVLVGVIIALVPDFRKAAAGDNSGNEFEFVLMLLVAIVPGSASNVLKERVLKGTDIDLFYFNAMVNLYQLGFGLLTVPMLFSPALMGASSSVAPAEFPTYVSDALLCVLGRGTSAGQDCGGTPSIMFFYILFNVTFNLCLLLVFRAGSATLAVVASALRVALSALGFQWRFLAGEAYAPLTRYDGAALALLLSGLACYRAQDEVPSENFNQSAAGGVACGIFFFLVFWVFWVFFLVHALTRIDSFFFVFFVFLQYAPIDENQSPPLLDVDEDSAGDAEAENERAGLLAALGTGLRGGGLGEDGSLAGWNPGPGEDETPYFTQHGSMTVHFDP
jgi:hypothetical protein